MKFEHLVEINDLTNPMVSVMTREQLWRGLVLRAESPKLFVDYIDECLLSERTAVSMTRQLRYGELVIADRVDFEHLAHVHYEVPAQQNIHPSSLRMLIEEPAPDALFVRFIYNSGEDANPDAENDMLNEYRRAAYQEADIDTIRVIRELAEAGRLDALPS
ncbi:SRPBCC family protein [Undibacterium fentianense]|uniref:DUF1857 family protein n=1 Tax=Undibacterium fentianense TaxID=2828728 RepID=A0A941E7Z6_9BURK|nr:SRPBCC family protein [Undibacterium fentianense]MBR7801418.1 DUF1857 family protein [Undibacterium fentianense]